MKLIDKSAVVAEIERGKIIARENAKTASDNNNVPVAALWSGKENICNELISFLNTLEVKEVDFHKELLSFYRHTNDSGSGIALAKHFFELGLKARTDKELIEEIYSHIDSIKNTADRMTSGNFMHNRAAIKFSANTIAKVLELIGIKAQKGEEL